MMIPSVHSGRTCPAFAVVLYSTSVPVPVTSHWSENPNVAFRQWSAACVHICPLKGLLHIFPVSSSYLVVLLWLHVYLRAGTIAPPLLMFGAVPSNRDAVKLIQ